MHDKSIELLNKAIGDQPAIQVVIDEALGAGIDHVVIVSSRSIGVRSPAAVAIIFCSATPKLKKRSGKAWRKRAVRVEPERSASNTTID